MDASSSNTKHFDKDMEKAIEEWYEELRDDVILGVCFEVHRAVKLGFFFLDEPSNEDEPFEIVDEVGRDVFGQVPLKKQFECICPNCKRNLAASRFAPHLEKCLGMGRNSSRIASKRIANTGKAECSDLDDFDNDLDWNYTSDRKPAKRKKDKNGPKRSRTKANKNEDGIPGGQTENSTISFDMKTIEEKKTLLNQVCGVISEHTKKMCTRSQRCPQHSDEQRRSIRNILLGSPSSIEDLIDVDTLDEGESHFLRLWESNSNNSSNPSPSDSNSTLNGATYPSSKRKFDKNAKVSANQKKGNRAKPSSTDTCDSSQHASMGLDLSLK